MTEAPVASTPDALVSFMQKLPFEIVGLEAGPMSQWLHKGLTDAGFEAVLMETREGGAEGDADQDGGMPRALRGFCRWDGTARCTANRCRRRRFGRSWPRASR